MRTDTRMVIIFNLINKIDEKVSDDLQKNGKKKKLKLSHFCFHIRIIGKRIILDEHLSSCTFTLAPVRLISVSIKFAMLLSLINR